MFLPNILSEFSPQNCFKKGALYFNNEISNKIALKDALYFDNVSNHFKSTFTFPGVG